jgi:dTDP-4-dehydrorhamnose 3,5-epimerase
LIFRETELDGAWIIEPDLLEDERGFFARTYCEDEFAAHDLASPMVQGNISYTAGAGTIRGMHYQLPPMMEAKYIRVLSGAIQDVIVDLRPWSRSYLQHIDVELSASNRLGIYVPPLFAHGHQALTDDVELSYLVSRSYTPGLERGIRHDDPRLAIDWRRPVTSLSGKDAAWPDLDKEAVTAEILVAVDESGGSVADPAGLSPEE